MKLSINIAWRYLKAKKTHNAVNIISIISVCGVVLATIALVCVLSVFNGFSSLMSDKLAMLDPQLKIQHTHFKTIANADSLVNIVSQIDGVEKCVPTIEEQALAVYGTKQMPVIVKGIPQDYNQVTSIHQLIPYGEYLLEDSINRYAIISIGVASQLSNGNGFFEYLKIYEPRRKGRINLSMPSTAFKVDSLYISGIYRTDQNTYDRDMIYLPLTVARRLLDYTREASYVEVKLKPNADEQHIASQIATVIGNDYIVKNRMMQQDVAFKMVNIEKWITFLLLSFILVIATFNVISSLSLLIIEKEESIRIFRTLGASDSMITRIFIIEGLLITVAGAVVGICLGLFLCLLQQEFGLIKLAASSAEVIVDSYPVKVIFSDIIVVFGLVCSVGLLTSLATAALMRSHLKND